MSYVKTIWKSGDKITAGNLNNMETGIDENARRIASTETACKNYVDNIVKNPTITINQGGTKKGSFTLNQSEPATIELMAYSAGTGLSLSGTTFSVKTGYTTNDKNYKVIADDSGNLYVNVPWENTIYTHPTDSGNKHIPAGGSKGNILMNTAAGTASWANISSGVKSDNSTTITSSISNNNVELGDSGVTAGSYGDTSNQTPSYGGTFKVPMIKVNAKGIVTEISTHTVQLPSTDDTDTKNTAGSTNSTGKLYLIGATAQADNPQTYSNSQFYVENGNVTGVSFTASSDKRLKENIEKVENIKLDNLNTYSYCFKSDESKRKRIGLIAQEVQETYPEVVVDDGEHLSLDYNAITALCVGKINELTAENKELKDKVNQLETRLNELARVLYHEKL